MSTVSLEELTKEKEKLEGDRDALVEQLQKLKTQAEGTQVQLNAISGAIQTCDYFIGKLQQSSQDSEPDGDGENEEDIIENSENLNIFSIWSCCILLLMLLLIIEMLE